jgi:hypothetical protein
MMKMKAKATWLMTMTTILDMFLFPTNLLIYYSLIQQVKYNGVNVKMQSPKQNKRFRFFWKRRKPLNVEFYWGHASSPPWVGFAELWVVYGLLRSRTNAFAFLEKKKVA